MKKAQRKLGFFFGKVGADFSQTCRPVGAAVGILTG